jgi:RNA-directed DNA polymerase
MTRDLMTEIASDEVLEHAFDWICDRRHDYSPHQDVWDVRWRWHELKPQVQERLLQGRYRLGPVQRFGDGDDAIEVWGALDALVLKAVAIVLARHWAFSPRCHHVADHGGAKAAVRAVGDALPDFPFVLRSDVKSYYASLDHELLLAQLHAAIADPRLVTLLERYVRRTVYQDGLYRDVTLGISLGCPLSPLIAALYLKPLDDRLEATGLFYARFMDDWVVLAPTRWKLGWAARLMQQTLAELKVQTHPGKTFLGRTSRGFDFLGYRFDAGGRAGVAEATVERFVDKATRLAKQGGTAPAEPGGAGIFERVTALVATLAGELKSAATERDEEAPAAGVVVGATAAAHEPRESGDDARSCADEREPWLYEQAAQISPPGPSRLEGLGGRCGAYVRRWCGWVTSGLAGSSGDGLQSHYCGASPTRPRRGRRCPATPT